MAGSLERGWNEAGFLPSTAAGWGPVSRYVNTTSYEGPKQPGLRMSLHEMPTIGVAETRRAISIT